jgi:hypothetical protein
MSAHPLTPEERALQYAAFSKRYEERKAELMVKYPHKSEAECGNRALEDVDEELGFK